MPAGKATAAAPSTKPSTKRGHQTVSAPLATSNHGDRFKASVQRLEQIILATDGSDRRLKDAWLQLKGVKASLDSGKTVTGAATGRGLPLRIVVQTLKASWHVDNTWPLDSEDLATMTTTGPGGANATPDVDPPIRPDPDPEAIADAYAA